MTSAEHKKAAIVVCMQAPRLTLLQTHFSSSMGQQAALGNMTG